MSTSAEMALCCCCCYPVSGGGPYRQHWGNIFSPNIDRTNYALLIMCRKAVNDHMFSPVQEIHCEGSTDALCPQRSYYFLGFFAKNPSRSEM